MNRQEFEMLRNLEGKTIPKDIRFEAARRGHDENSLCFSDVEILNEHGYELVMNGTYKPLLKTVVLNVVQRGVGPVCRLCVRGLPHKDTGRTHKHEMKEESDSLATRNLPYAYARPELAQKSPAEIWETFCREANIVHQGTFFDPQVGG